jgi:hypothetical protein
MPISFLPLLAVHATSNDIVSVGDSLYVELRHHYCWACEVEKNQMHLGQVLALRISFQRHRETQLVRAKRLSVGFYHK